MKKILKKRKCLVMLVGCLILNLTSCGAGVNSFEDSSPFVIPSNTKGSSFVSSEHYSDEESNNDSGGGNDYGTQNVDIQVSPEKLVYTSYIDMDVLDFDGFVSSLDEKVKQYGGFVESERISDSTAGTLYLDLETPVWHTLTATLRIPSESYEVFCNEIADLGYLHSKDSQVDNLSQEYKDLTTDLKIYEAKEARYLERLSKAKDDSTAVSIENSLTDLQIEISRIKTRMNEIQTDATYSYVRLTANEIKKRGVDNSVYRPSFKERFTDILSNSMQTFLKFLEFMLYVLIYFLPYLILLFIFVLLWRKAARFIKKRKTDKLKKANKNTSKESDSGDEDTDEDTDEDNDKDTNKDNDADSPVDPSSVFHR